MTDALLHDDRALRLDRRQLLAAGGAGIAALWLAPIGGVAEAATLRPELKRTTWLGLADPGVTASVDGRRTALRLVEVADLPIATTIPALRGHDGAFALRFTGAPGLEQGTHALEHTELGAFELFLVPVGSAGPGRRYEAIVDRTVRIAGVNEEGAPVHVSVPEARAEQPAAGAPAAPVVTAAGVPVSRVAAAPRARRRPRLRRLAVRRATNRRSATIELSVASLGTTRTLNALLLRRGRVVGRGASTVRAGRPLRVRVAARRVLDRGQHELVLTLVDGEGRIVRIRRRVRLG
jgi:hypothetical protein